MDIHLSEERKQIARALAQDGRFTSAEESIGEVIRPFQEHEDQAKLAELRRAIAIGIEQVERGELVSFDPHATLERIRSPRASAAGQS